MSDRAAAHPPPLDLRGPIGRADVETVCVRACAGWPTGAGPVLCDVGGLGPPALPTVEVLARLALAARRGRRDLRLERTSSAILELVALCGLADVLAAHGEPPDERPGRPPPIRRRGGPAGRTAGRTARCRGRT